jgi:hypothetical protein
MFKKSLLLPFALSISCANQQADTQTPAKIGEVKILNSHEPIQETTAETNEKVIGSCLTNEGHKECIAQENYQYVWLQAALPRELRDTCTGQKNEQECVIKLYEQHVGKDHLYKTWAKTRKSCQAIFSQCAGF